MLVTIIGDLKIKEENEGVTFSCQGLEYSEIPVTQHRISEIKKVFQNFNASDPLLAIRFALNVGGQEDGIPFLEEWNEGIYTGHGYLRWLKIQFERALADAS